MGENATFKGGEDLLRCREVEVVNLHNLVSVCVSECGSMCCTICMTDIVCDYVWEWLWVNDWAYSHWLLTMFVRSVSLWWKNSSNDLPNSGMKILVWMTDTRVLCNVLFDSSRSYYFILVAVQNILSDCLLKYGSSIIVDLSCTNIVGTDI